MENNQPPAQPAPAAAPTVTITQAEYQNLQTQAAQSTPALAPAPTPQTNIGGQSYPLEVPKNKTTVSEKIWFAFAILVLISFVLPVAWFFVVPLGVFAVLGAVGFFRDAGNHRSGAKGTILAFKIIAALGISMFVAIGVGMVLLAIAFGGSGM